MANKSDQVTGVVTIALGGITASLTAAQAMEWGTVLMNLAPVILIGFLIWRIRKLDSQLKDCQENHQKVTNQMMLAYMAMKDPGKASQLPDMKTFIDGDFDIKKCLDDFCDLDD